MSVQIKKLIFGKMKRFFFTFFLVITTVLSLSAQDNNDLALARQYASNGEPQKALDIYQKLYKQNNEAYFNVYITGLLGVKKFDEAISTAKKMVKKHPAEPQYNITLGTIYTQQGSINKANEIYDALIKNMPADQNYIAVLASQFYQSANIDYAIKIFLQGRKLLQSDRIFSYELINLYRYKRDKPALIEEYLNFLPTNPPYLMQAENTMATIFEGSADYDLLKAELLKRIQKDPQQTLYPELLSWQFMQQKQFDQALNQALALSRRQNDDGSAIFELCRTLVTNEAYDTAIRGYEYLVSKGKENQFYIPAKIEAINTRNLRVTTGKYTNEDLLALEKDYVDLLTEFGKNSKIGRAHV